MSISITCSSCGSKLRAPDKTAGRSILCPKCKTSCTVPNVNNPTPGNAATPQPTVPVQSSQTKALIPCETCQKSMAVTANACPACGAANTWVHPDIVRFNQEKHKLQLKAPAQVYTSSTYAFGNATVKRQKQQNIVGGWSVMVIGIAPFLLSYIGFFKNHPDMVLYSLLFIPLGIGVLIYAAFQKDLPEDVKFEVHLTESPPRWQSNDDEFWKPVKDFFVK
ncbi:MAG: DUF3784 domain-containing protein [Planctomycetia bacterium]|nr:DUF3784 domain-containing protein [Planctomycetia bacterium]